MTARPAIRILRQETNLWMKEKTAFLIVMIWVHHLSSLFPPYYLALFCLSPSFCLFPSLSLSLLDSLLFDFGFDAEADDGLGSGPEESEGAGAEGEALAMIRPKAIKTMRIASLSAFSKYIFPSPRNGYWSCNYDIA